MKRWSWVSEVVVIGCVSEEVSWAVSPSVHEAEGKREVLCVKEHSILLPCYVYILP